MAKLHPMLEPFAPAPTAGAAGPVATTSMALPVLPPANAVWDRTKAAHLLNRVAFGGTDAEVTEVYTLGPVAAIDKLLDFPDAPVEEITPSDQPDFSGIADYPRTFSDRQKLFQDKTPEERKIIQQQLMAANEQALHQTAGWWMGRMASGPYPVQEKLTLFWHGHFTTSARDERSAWLMYGQNETLRTYAAGNFARFVGAISHDPAMLDYLNNQQNRKSHPNENYARELMELFTLGIGHYTENDVKEAARAFTGWAHDGEGFVFRKFDHDTGSKYFLGQQGNFDGQDVVNIILQQPACATYIATCLWEFFVNENPDPAICQSLGQYLRDSDYELRPALRVLFSSKAFYADENVGAMIKSPVQLLVGLGRQLAIKDMRYGRFIGQLKQMGQEPLMPPNVKGWPGGRQWINTSTLFVRQNTAVGLTSEKGAVVQRPEDKGLSVAEAVDAWLGRMIQRPVHADRRQVIVDATGDVVTDASLRNMINLIVSMPEYQLC